MLKKVIGMDGGGTSLKVTLVGNNKYASFNYDLGVNVSAVSEDSIREALGRVKSDTGAVDSIVAAFAGAGDPVRSSKIMKAVKAIFPEARVEVVSDLEGLHRACFGDKPGVVVVSGTGAGVFGRDHSGSFHRAGGWGHLFDDEGSAFWIATQIICQALRFRDGIIDFDPVFERLLEFYDLKTIEEIINTQTEAQFKSRIAAFAQPALDMGSLLAESVMHEGVQLLVRRTIAVIEKTHAGEQIQVSGGMFASSKYLRAFQTAIKPVQVIRFKGRVDQEIARLASLSNASE